MASRKQPDGSRARFRARSSVRVGLVLLAAAAACVAAAGPGTAASSSVAVSLSVGSTTVLNPGTCTTAQPSVTMFGTVQAGASVVTAADCTVTFGSASSSAMLRTFQADGYGVAMARLPDGSLDVVQGTDGDHFSTDGRLNQSIGPGTNEARAAGIQVLGANAGKLVTAGWATIAAGDTQLVVARWEVDGDLDLTFGGGDGFVDVNPTAFRDESRGLAIGSDDAIYVTSQHNDSGSGSAGGVFRFTVDGTLDTSFSAGDGTNGYFEVASGEFQDVDVTSDGKVISAGTRGSVSVVRLNQDGGLDTTFGTGGVGTIDCVSGWDKAEAQYLQADGKIVVAGNAWNVDNNDTIVARFNADGTPDTGFGTNGCTLMNFGVAGADDRAIGVVVQPGGAVVAVGHTGSSAMVARFTSTGVLDTTFAAPTGWRQIDLGPAAEIFEKAIVHPDGAILAVGQGSDATSDGDMVAVRLLRDGANDTSFGGDGIELLDFPGSTIAFDVVLGNDSKYTIVGNGTSSNHGLVRLESVRLTDFDATTNHWTSATSLFGACLRAVGGGATNVWPVTGACTSTDNAPWKGVPQQPGTAGKVATTASGNASGTASLRFGVKTAASQAVGQYVAPLVFEVVAPAA